MTAPLQPLPGLGPATPWWRIEALDWDMATATELVSATGFNVTPRASDVGGGQVTVRNAEAGAAQLMSEHTVVRFGVLDLAATAANDGEPVYRILGAGIGDQPTDDVVPAKESAGQLVNVSLRGILAQWAYSPIDGPGGEDAAVTPAVRAWNFAHHSIDVHSAPWVDATYRSIVGDTSAVAPNGLGGKPWHFANFLAFWLAPQAAGAGSDPEGPFLLAFDYDHAGGEIIFEGTADDAFSVWLNEIELGRVWDYPNGDASDDPYRGMLNLEAGTVRVRVAVANFPKPGNPKNCGLFAGCASTPIWTASGYDESWLFTTANGYSLTAGSPGRWRALGYSDAATIPGCHVGYAITEPFGEAQARGELVAWSLGFSATHDSNGVEWERFTGLDGFTIEVGASMLDLLERLRDGGWIEYAVSWDENGKPVLEAWGASTTIGDDLGAVYTVGQDVTGLQHKADHAGAADRALVLWPGARTWIGTPGPKAITISVDAESAAEAIAKATAVLNKSVRVDAWTLDATWLDQATGPFFGQQLFDSVDLPTTAAVDGPRTSFRIVGFDASASSATGRPVYKVQFNAQVLEAERRVARIASRAATTSGRSAATLPIRPWSRPLTKVERIERSWNLPGTAVQAVSGLEPVPKLMRLTRFGATATSGTGTTTCLVRNGSSLVANVDIGAGTPVFAWNPGLGSVVRPEQPLQASIGYTIAGGTALGTHKDLVLIGYGAAMGVSPEALEAR